MAQRNLPRKNKIDIANLPAGKNKNLTPVATASKVGVKRPVSSRMANDIRNIGNSLFREIILPDIKSSVESFFQNAVHMIFNPGNASIGRGYTNYNKIGSRRRTSSSYSFQRRPMQRVEEIRDYVYQDPCFEERWEAETVLSSLFERLAEYPYVTVGDLLQLSGQPSNHTHETWGWGSIKGTKVIYINGEGYVIDLPPPQHIG